jgi:large subunit ribosomal protein L21
VYALVRTGGKQYRVEEGKSLRVDQLLGEPGSTVELGEVLVMGDGDNLTVGTPLVEGARVLATVAEQGRARKVVVFRYKAKTRSRKKTGHRQHYTRLVVEDILAAGQEPKPKRAMPAADEEPAAVATKGRRRRVKADAQTAAPDTDAALEPEAAPSAEAPAVVPEADEAASAEAPAKRSRRKKEETE